MIKKFEIEGLLLIDPRKFHDERGYFFESFNIVGMGGSLSQGKERYQKLKQLNLI